MGTDRPPVEGRHRGVERLRDVSALREPEPRGIYRRAMLVVATSTPLLLERRVQSLELDACILRSEAPLDLSGRGVASLLLGSHLRLEALEIWHSSIEALSAEYTQLDLGHVEPAAML